jgi:hypothetical protein
MDYNLNIVASVKGQAQLDSTLRTIGQIRNLARDLKPLDFGTGRKGALADEIRKAKSELDKFARGVTNAMQQGEKTTGLFSSTLAGVTGQARAFGIALDNINFNKNAAEAKNYANALAQAEAKAEGLTAVQNELIRQARQQAGVAIGPATQLGSPEALAQQVRFESAQIEKGNRLREEQARIVERINDLAANKVKTSQFDSQIAKINLALDERQVDAAEKMTEELKDQIRQNERIINQNKKKKKDAEEEGITARKRAGNILQGALLGGGFPILFGGPSFSAVGGLAGGAIGGSIGPTGRPGFAGGIAGSVVGGVFDAVIKAALELGKALENPTKNLQALTNQLPIAGTATKGLIEQLNEAGLSSVAASLALSALNDELDALGLDDKEIKKFKEQTQEFENAFKKLKIASSALASDGLINFMTLITKLANVFRENKDGIVQGIRALGGLVIGEDQALGEQMGMGPTVTVPPGPLAAAADAGPLKQTASEVDPVKTAEEIRAQEILADLARREIKFATDAAAIEENRLALIRGRLAEANAIVDIDKAQFKLIKAQLNFDTETNGALKEQLRIKRDIAQAELDQAVAAKNNATILRIQADAAFDLERRTVAQAEVMKDLQAGIAAEQAIRATSPFQNESFLTDPFFGGSRKLESEQNIRFTETLRVMKAELADVNKNIELGTLLNDDEKRALEDKRKELENNISRYKEYQPAIDEAALAQKRFTEAMAVTVPVTDSLFDSLIAVVEGTKTAEQAFADFLRSIASMLVDAAKQMIATYIAIGVARMFAGLPKMSSGETIDITAVDPNIVNSLGGLTPRANGGPVGAGRSYLVGERGPELFVPGAQGNIVPNNAMGGANVTVNVDASGSSVEGNADQASQLGKAIGIAVQQELVKQKRPGGLLAR